MRRSHVHAAFGGLALVCASLAGYQALQLYRAERVNDTIAQAGERVLQKKPLDASATRRVRLADAVALSNSGDHERAFIAFNGLIPRGSMDDLAQAALYDLGNMYLKQALAHPGNDAAAVLPLVELAKQRYRDLLRVNPDQWDARYNLERALRMAPEDLPAFSEREDDPQAKRQVVSPDMIEPDLP